MDKLNKFTVSSDSVAFSKVGKYIIVQFTKGKDLINVSFLRVQNYE